MKYVTGFLAGLGLLLVMGIGASVVWDWVEGKKKIAYMKGYDKGRMDERRPIKGSAV